MKKKLTALLLMTIMLAGTTTYAATVDYYLRADVFSIPAGAYSALPAPAGTPSENIMMWGFSLCTAGFASCGAPTVPGPAMTAHEGDTVRVHVLNNLTSAALLANAPNNASCASAGVPFACCTGAGAGTCAATPFAEKDGTLPISLIVPGQKSVLAPVFINPSTGAPVPGTSRAPGDLTSRVRSFNKETLVGASTVYTWSAVKSGTYLYESGTHPAVQIQMGLYGPLAVYPVGVTPGLAGQAYTGAPSTAYDAEVTLLYSEIDQELHYSIASGLYGTPPPAPGMGTPVRGQRTSTVDYNPVFFLINGHPFINAAQSTIPNAGTHGLKTLVRFLNAGLLEKTPSFINQYVSIVAEDGNPYAYQQNGVRHLLARKQYSLLLPAEKTMDVIVRPPAAGSMPVFDRSLNLTNAALSPGGAMVYLSIN